MSASAGGTARVLTLAVLLFVEAAPALAQRRFDVYEGRPLMEALRALQAEGVPLVFSSKIVTPDMRVDSVPRATTARAILDELLDPHDLKAVTGPGGVIQVVRASGAPPGSQRPPRDRAAGAVRGRVVDAATGVPLPAVLVQLVSARRSARTDQAGRFHLADVESRVDTLRVSTDGYALETREIGDPAGKTVALTVGLARLRVTYRERLTVMPGRSHPWEPSAGRGSSLDRRDFREMRGVLTNDPLRAVQTLPGVAATDDFRAEFSVRGSPYRHLGVVVDGVATPWLRHTAPGRGDMGSLSMFGGDLLETATLHVGAHPQRHGNILGAHLGLTLREGSRDTTRLRGALGGTNAAITAEGPVGTSGRGSWLASARQSYLDWPIRRGGEQSGTVFGFADGLAKLVYDASPTQQASVSVLGGRSAVDERDERDDRPPHALGDGTNRSVVVNVSWRSTLGAGTLLSQRAYLVDHQFLNETETGQAAGRGRHRQVSYRADLFRTLSGGVLEVGGQVQRFRTFRQSSSSLELDANRPSRSPGRLVGSSWLRSGYVHFAWAPAPQLTVSPGVRVSDSTLVPRPAVLPWILGEWSLASAWTVKAGAGVSHQFPEFEAARGESGLAPLQPERATHVDLGIERRFGESVRWQATLFAREERDVLLEWPPYPRPVRRVLIEPVGPGRQMNVLSGSTRGVELLLERRSSTGLSGWVAYSFGKARYTDATDGETFWGDFDQRHAITLSGLYRFTEKSLLAVILRSGSNFPIPGYLGARDDGLFVAERRNETRLPAYVRLDVRVSRSFTYAGRRMSVFAEILNVLNLGTANGVVRPETGEAVGFTRAMLPRLPSAGLVVEF